MTPSRPRIAMTPWELPLQRVHAVVDLPSRPEGFAPIVCFGWSPDDILPKRRPSNMLYLGSTEWAWSPFNNRLEACFLHRGRRHWILYIQDLDPNEPELAWRVGAYAEKRSATARQAACHLLIAMWKDEVVERDLDHFHWINQEAYLAVADWMAIARAVWADV